jgi:hypothetical protein
VNNLPTIANCRKSRRSLSKTALPHSHHTPDGEVWTLISAGDVAHLQAVREFSDGDGRRVEMHMSRVRAEYEQRLREIEARVAAQKAEDNKSRELIVQLIDAGYRAMAKTLHPDMGGSHDDMTRLTAVRDELRRRVA